MVKDYIGSARLVFAVVLMLAFVSTASALERSVKVMLKGDALKIEPAKVTVQDIEKLPLSSYKTFNPFDKKTHMYKGVLLKDLASWYAAPECTLIVFTALDGYVVTFTRDEWERWDIMLATQDNGKYMTVKDSGPMRIVMPYDTAKGLDKEAYTPKWIWLVKSIEFKTK